MNQSESGLAEITITPDTPLRLSLDGMFVFTNSCRVRHAPSRLLGIGIPFSNPWIRGTYQSHFALSDFRINLSDVLARHLGRRMLETGEADLAMALHELEPTCSEWTHERLYEDKELQRSFSMDHEAHDHDPSISYLLAEKLEATWTPDQIAGDSRLRSLQKELEELADDYLDKADEIDRAAEIAQRYAGLIDFAIPLPPRYQFDTPCRTVVFADGEPAPASHFYQVQRAGGMAWDGALYSPDQEAIPCGFTPDEPLCVRCEAEIEPDQWVSVTTRAVKLFLIDHFAPKGDEISPARIASLRDQILATDRRAEDEHPAGIQSG